MYIKNADGRTILLSMVEAIHENRQYLSDIDGLIGDGDHGMNMNKGFVMYGERLGDDEVELSEGLYDLGSVLLNEIGGSMGPIYGTIFMEMSDVADGEDDIDADLFMEMLEAGLTGLYDIVDARPGDKTLVDTLSSAIDGLRDALNDGAPFDAALEAMKEAAEAGKESTRDMIARYGRASRLGERSRGVLDAGATSCQLILSAMADGMLSVMVEE